MLSISKVESKSKCPCQIDVIISRWICLSKSMKFPQISHKEFRRRIDGESTKMCQLGKSYNPMKDQKNWLKYQSYQSEVQMIKAPVMIRNNCKLNTEHMEPCLALIIFYSLGIFLFIQIMHDTRHSSAFLFLIITSFVFSIAVAWIEVFLTFQGLG